MSSEALPIQPDQQLVIANMQKQLARYEEAFSAAQPQQQPLDDDFIDLMQIWNALVRRRWTVIIIAAVILVVTLIATAMMTPVYRATTVVQIEREAGKMLEYQDVSGEQGAGAREFYQTQYELLQSRTLARRVIDQLGLRQRVAQPGEEEVGVIAGLLAPIKGLFSTPRPVGEEVLPPDLESAFLRNLSVSPVANSRLVRVSFDSPVPAQAALVANTLATSFVDMSLERRFEASTYAKGFLEDRLKQVRADLEDSELAMVEYSQARGIVDQEDKQGVLMDTLREMNNARVAVEMERIKAESQYQEMLTASPASLAEAMNSSVIQDIKTRRSVLQSEYQEGLKLYKPSYPKMQQLNKQITQLDLEVAGRAVRGEVITEGGAAG